MIYFFGDSFTAGICEDNSSGENKQYLDKTYGEYVAEKLKQPYEVHGLPGACTMDIYQSIISRLVKFKKGDTIVVGGTATGRIQIPGIQSKKILDFRAPFKDIGEYGEEDKLTLVPWYSSLWRAEVDKDKREEKLRSILPGYSGPNLYRTGEAISLFVNDIMLGYAVNYENYCMEWFYSLKVYFDSIDVKVLHWDYHWWSYIKNQVKSIYRTPGGSGCDCGHWDNRGVQLFAEYVVTALDSGDSTLRVPAKR